MNDTKAQFPVAHSKPPSEWQSLETHLRQVADLAGQHAAAFNATSWGRLIGLWHDLGKFSPDFQKYIRQSSEGHLEDKPGRINHSSAGALIAIEKFGKVGRLLAYCIMGHHAGLPDWQNAISPQASLAWRLSQSELLAALSKGEQLEKLTTQPFPKEKANSCTELSRSLWVRMLFSCLVDADFLDTEAFMDPDKARLRLGYLKWTPWSRQKCPGFKLHFGWS